MGELEWCWLALGPFVAEWLRRGCCYFVLEVLNRLCCATGLSDMSLCWVVSVSTYVVLYAGGVVLALFVC